MTTAMPEAEARQKWCPFARVAIPFAKGTDRNHKEWFSAVAGNRGPLSPEVVTFTDGTPSNPTSARCIASECMAWRWESDDQLSERTISWAGGVQEGASTKGGPPVRGGYCGLAGAL